MIRIGQRVWFTSTTLAGQGVPGTWRTGTLVADYVVQPDDDQTTEVRLGTGSIIERA